MTSKTFKQKFLRPLPLLLSFTILVAGVIGAVVVTVYMDVPTMIASFGTKQVTVTELQQGKLKPVILIDVRSPEEYDEDHIDQSTLVPIEDIESGFGIKQIQAIAAATKSSPIKPTLVLYCTSGRRSMKAFKRLEATGLNLVVLTGGIKAWRQTVSATQDAAILAPISLSKSVN